MNSEPTNPSTTATQVKLRAAAETTRPRRVLVEKIKAPHAEINTDGESSP